MVGGTDLVAALHQRLLAELATPGDWWDAAARRALMEEARAAVGCARCADGLRHGSVSMLPVAAVEVVHGVVNEPGRLTRAWASRQIDELGDARYAEIVGLTAIIVAIDLAARGRRPAAGVGRPHRRRAGRVAPRRCRPSGRLDPDDRAEAARQRDARALSLVPRTNATWRTLVTESYSRGPEMLELTWQRALTRPQTELIAAQISRLQECFY